VCTVRNSVLVLRTLGLVAWALAGCGSSNNAGPFDGGLADAAIVDGVVIDGPDGSERDAAMFDAMFDAVPDAPVPDAMADAAPLDAAVPDAAVPDALQLDAAVPDAAMLDAAVPDAPQLDAAVPDAPRVDAAVPDAAILDAAVPDAPRVDAAVPDAAILDAAVLDAVPSDAADQPGGHLRLVAGNLTTGNFQAYEQPGIRIFRGLAPDVAMIQEFNVGTDTTAELRSFVDQAFGAQFTFVRGVASGQIPNGIVSRYPIIASGDWTDTEVGNRTFVWAQIDIPGPIDLYAISVHLLSSTASERNIEAGELVQHIQGLPANAYVVLAGDFNTDSRTEGCIQALSSVLTTTGPFPVDEADLDTTNANRNKPYDWVLVNGGLQALETDTTIGSHVFAHGFVADTRVYTPIADLAPALVGDSGAPSMQHMAVVRDFTLPGGTPPPPSVHVTAPNGGEMWAAGSNQTVRWTSTGVTSVSVELSIDGATWTTLSASTAASAGQLAVTAPMVMTMAARVRVTAVPAGTPVDVSDAPFTISTMPPPVGKVFLNEVLANEPGSDVTGEFVELVNSGTGDADLSGWTISDAVQVRHTFAAGTVLRAGRAIVVFGDTAGIPAGLTNAIAASTHQLNLSNGGDTVTLKSPTATIDSLTYTAAQAVDGVSLNRSPDGDPAGAFVLHTALSALMRSPGTRVTGAAF
jgi:endonuclease/exonuclease/phosphatase family metal-dependent hydrolase